MKLFKTIGLLTIGLLLCSFVFSGGDKTGWKYLKGIEIKASFDPKTELFQNEIKFPKKAKRKEGKRLLFIGYISEGRILSKDRMVYGCCLSRYNPLDEMIELNIKEPLKTEQNRRIVLEGTLKLNRKNDISHCYKLDDVAVLGFIPDEQAKK